MDLFQDWELQRERLIVRRAILQTTSTSYTPKRTTHDKSIVGTDTLNDADRLTDCTSDSSASCADFTREDYTRGCSQFWADVPHQTFTVVGKAKKRKRNADGRSGVGSPEKKKKIRPKKRKKKHKAYLVSEWMSEWMNECFPKWKMHLYANLMFCALVSWLYALRTMSMLNVCI